MGAPVMEAMKRLDEVEVTDVQVVGIEEIALREERAGFCICSYGGDN